MNLLKAPLFFVFAIPVLSIAQDPRGMACDFENEVTNWSGDGSIVTDETGFNKVYSLKKTADSRPELTFTVTVPKDGEIEIRFRVRGMQGGKNLTLRKAMRRPDGAWFNSHKIKANGQWEERAHWVRDKDGSGPHQRTFALIAREGVGEIQIDDIEVTKGGKGSPNAAEPKVLLTTREEYWPLGDNAAILIPLGWEVIDEGHPPPILLSAERNRIAISAMSESPEQVKTTNLEEYATLKATTLAGNFPDFEASPLKSGKIGELSAVFFQGPSTIEGVQTALNAMAIQGEKEFYLLLGVAAPGASATEKAEVMRLFRSFRLKENAASK